MSSAPAHSLWHLGSQKDRSASREPPGASPQGSQRKTQRDHNVWCAADSDACVGATPVLHFLGHPLVNATSHQYISPPIPRDALWPITALHKSHHLLRPPPPPILRYARGAWADEPSFLLYGTSPAAQWWRGLRRVGRKWAILRTTRGKCSCTAPGEDSSLCGAMTTPNEVHGESD
ncbi:hypothetical protein BC628DRAFT_152682 [Trametes gibbosa]|nr:hypothetical protein BC628DRAFT_152682 [Trametes gibbosa]